MGALVRIVSWAAICRDVGSTFGVPRIAGPIASADSAALGQDGTPFHGRATVRTGRATQHARRRRDNRRPISPTCRTTSRTIRTAARQPVHPSLLCGGEIVVVMAALPAQLPYDAGIISVASRTWPDAGFQSPPLPHDRRAPGIGREQAPDGARDHRRGQRSANGCSGMPGGHVGPGRPPGRPLAADVRRGCSPFRTHGLHFPALSRGEV
jgi:hypothetical protein